MNTDNVNALDLSPNPHAKEMAVTGIQHPNLEKTENCFVDELDVNTNHEVKKEPKEEDNLDIVSSKNPKKLFKVTPTNLKSVLRHIKMKKKLKKECPVNEAIKCEDQEENTKPKREYKYIKETTVCKSCGAVLGSKDSLRQHYRRFHKDHEPFPCEHCGKIFFLREDFRKHTNGVHGAENQYTCHLCNQSFRRLNSLKAHKLRAHNIGIRYSCNVCMRTYTSVQSLKRHYQMHDPNVLETSEIKAMVCEDKNFITNKQHTCQVCNHMFKSVLSLQRHVKIAHAGSQCYKNHVCSVCGKRFADRTVLKRHLVIHTNFKPYRCFVCNRSFSFKNSLERHNQIHTGLNKYKIHHCDFCGRSFNQLSSLKRHVLIHTDSKPYSCSICGDTFRHTTARNRHMAKVHVTTWRDDNNTSLIYGINIDENGAIRALTNGDNTGNNFASGNYVNTNISEVITDTSSNNNQNKSESEFNNIVNNFAAARLRTLPKVHRDYNASVNKLNEAQNEEESASEKDV